MKLAELAQQIVEYEAELAPGSETMLLGDFVGDITSRYHPPADWYNYPAEAEPVEVDDDVAAWWLAAYDYMSEHPDADTDEIVAAADASPEQSADEANAELIAQAPALLRLLAHEPEGDNSDIATVLVKAEEAKLRSRGMWPDMLAASPGEFDADPEWYKN